MRLDLRFSTRPLEDLWCQAVAALVFQKPNIISDPLLGLDEKMGGFLVNLVESGNWTGKRGERFLLAPQNMIKADKLLFHGMGSISDYGIRVLGQCAFELGKTFDKMQVNEFGINIPVWNDKKNKYHSHLEVSAQNLFKPFYDHHNHKKDFLLKIIFSVEREFMDRLESVVENLRSYFTPMLDVSIIIDYGPKDMFLESTG